MITKIKNLLKAKGHQKPYVSELSPDNRIYCIGDIHGRYDLLRQLHQSIITDAENCQFTKTVIYLGDYIDRGRFSKQVIDYLLSNPLPSAFKNIFLLGNHEQVLLAFLRDPSKTGKWFDFGGLSTLASYDVAISGIPHSRQLHALSLDFQQKIPDTHLRFFQQLLPYYEKDGYYFVHAGVRPHVKLKHQRIEDLLWIRDEFLNSQRFHGKVIVHGHSVSDAPVVCSNRIGIDTGAFYSNILTCLVLEGNKKRFLSTTS